VKRDAGREEKLFSAVDQSEKEGKGREERWLAGRRKSGVESGSARLSDMLVRDIYDSAISIGSVRAAVSMDAGPPVFFFAILVTMKFLGSGRESTW
jgi:hypothetical protein